MTGVVHSWGFWLSAFALVGVLWLLDRARRLDPPNWPCACGHARRYHEHFNEHRSHCGVCECGAYGGLSVRAARRRDVALARSREVPASLTVPSRLDPAMAQALAQARLNRHQEYDTAAMDRMVDDVERGGQR